MLIFRRCQVHLLSNICQKENLSNFFKKKSLNQNWWITQYRPNGRERRSLSCSTIVPMNSTLRKNQKYHSTPWNIRNDPTTPHHCKLPITSGKSAVQFGPSLDCWYCMHSNSVDFMYWWGTHIVFESFTNKSSQSSIFFQL